MQLKSLSVVIAALAVTATSCVDDKYDLSDIDTTTRIQVNDLVVPVNLDAVTLGDIITFDDDSKIKPYTIGGKEVYALRESGSFESEDIYIDPVTAAAPQIDPTVDVVRIIPENAPLAVTPPSIDPSTFNVKYELVEMGSEFVYDARDIDKSVINIKSAKVDNLTFSITLSANEVQGKVNNMFFSNVDIQVPKGMNATTSVGTYNPATGIWHIEYLKVADTAKTSISITTSTLDFAANGCSIVNHELHFNSKMMVKRGGILTFEPKLVNGIPMELPAELNFRLDYKLTALNVTAITGRIEYKLDGMDIDPVSLEDIPDFLAGSDTDIKLANPQIYIQVNNPVAADKLECRTGLTLEAIRGSVAKPFSPDNGAFTIGYDKGIAGPYNFMLSPVAVNESDIPTSPVNYSQAKWVEFSKLGSLLAADGTNGGIPEKIGIRLDDPQIPESDVTDFGLGRSIPGVKGSYELLAPLALQDGSRVVYSDRETGWNDDTLDAITIQNLTLSCTVDNQCPVAVKLYAYPLDVRGNRIPGVEIKSTTLAAGKREPLEITMTGTITHLDGVEYVAELLGSADNNALSPAQTVTLTDIRAKVNGFYEKEL